MNNLVYHYIIMHQQRKHHIQAKSVAVAKKADCTLLLLCSVCLAAR